MKNSGSKIVPAQSKYRRIHETSVLDGLCLETVTYLPVPLVGSTVLCSNVEGPAQIRQETGRCLLYPNVGSYFGINKSSIWSFSKAAEHVNYSMCWNSLKAASAGQILYGAAFAAL